MNETLHIERYLLGELQGGDRLLVEARLLTDTGFRRQLEHQRTVHALAKAYGRKLLSEEIRRAERRVFAEHRFRRFQRTIHQLFNRSE